MVITNYRIIQTSRFDKLDLENLIQQLEDLDNEKENAVERGASQFAKKMKERRNNSR
ncbi:DUF29 family protein [Trichormus azollae]|uniref:DUF29 family protein n=1 Tax=Trichormus azollae TaxID=1164 RepID=UPI00325C77F2